MARIVKEDEPFERIEEPRDKAIEICRDLGQTLKVEHIEQGLADQPTLSFYRQGEFHRPVPRPRTFPAPGAIGAFKLLSVAGAYWKGDATRQQLQRLYGTAWFTQGRAGRISGTWSKRPSAAIIACWASNSNCSRPIRSSARG